jgi:hypothetical protein
LLIATLPGVEAGAKNLKVAVVQTKVEPPLEENLT